MVGVAAMKRVLDDTVPARMKGTGVVARRIV